MASVSIEDETSGVGENQPNNQENNAEASIEVEVMQDNSGPANSEPDDTSTHPTNLSSTTPNTGATEIIQLENSEESVQLIDSLFSPIQQASQGDSILWTPPTTNNLDNLTDDKESGVEKSSDIYNDNRLSEKTTSQSQIFLSNQDKLSAIASLSKRIKPFPNMVHHFPVIKSTPISLTEELVTLQRKITGFSSLISQHSRKVQEFSGKMNSKNRENKRWRTRYSEILGRFFLLATLNICINN